MAIRVKSNALIPVSVGDELISNTELRFIFPQPTEPYGTRK
jgi:hypothetical protein